MKDFDIELARQGRPVCTKNGYKARVLCFDLNNEKYPIVAAITREDGTETVECYTAEGRYEHPREHNQFDLMMASEKHEGWTGMFKPAVSCPFIACMSYVFKTEEEAKAALGNADGCIAVVKVEWEE